MPAFVSTSKRRLEEFRRAQRVRHRPAAQRESRQDSAAGPQKRIPPQTNALTWRLPPHTGRYARLLRRHSRPLSATLLLSIVSLAIDLAGPLASAYLVDQVILNQALPAAQKAAPLLAVAGGMGAMYLLSAGLAFIRNHLTQLTSSKLAFELRVSLFRRVIRLPLSTLAEHKAGGILSRISTDVDNTTGLYQQALLTPALALLRLVVTLAVVFSLNAHIATFVLVVIPPVLTIQALRAGRLRPIWRSLSQDRQSIDGRLAEAIGGIRVVRTFRREAREEIAFTQGHHTVIRKQLLANAIQRTIATVWELIVPLAQLLILCFGGYLVTQGRTTLGVVMAFQSYLWRLLEPLLQLATAFSGTQRGLASMDRVFELLDEAQEPPDAPDAVPAPPSTPTLRFDHVSFGYRPGAPVLQGIDLEVPAGTTLAICGPSGAGKTTLTDLVARLYDPTEGRLLLDSVDLRAIQRQSYRRLLGVVSQDVFLFDGSIQDNIAYAKPQADAKEIEWAARQANAHEFIERLEHGYDTVIGERGVKLSGGQRQRLSIARALLADPRILILDEATSSLDSESEQLIHSALERLRQGRTTFVIAHRLSTITRADRIVVLEDGRIVEQGTHQELVARQGRYAALLAQQSLLEAQEPRERRGAS